MLVAVSTGPVEEGDALVRALREVAEPIADLLGPMPYQMIQSLLDPLWAKGIHSYFKATNLARPRRRAHRAARGVHLTSPGPQCEIHVHQMGGAVATVPEGATAFVERSMPFVLNAVDGLARRRPGRRCRAHGMGSHGDRCRFGCVDRSCVRELPRRHRRWALVLRRRDVRPPRRAEERVRPDERVPAQPEHRAVWLIAGGRARREEGARALFASAGHRRDRRGMRRFVRGQRRLVAQRERDVVEAFEQALARDARRARTAKPPAVHVSRSTVISSPASARAISSFTWSAGSVHGKQARSSASSAGRCRRTTARSRRRSRSPRAPTARARATSRSRSCGPR